MAVAVIVRDGLTLLAHRHPGRAWYPDCWDLVGGHLDPGEAPLAALRRECREELGIEVVAAHPMEVESADPSIELHAFLVADWAGEPQNRAPQEHDDLRWFAVHELEALRLADPAVLPLLCRVLTADPS